MDGLRHDTEGPDGRCQACWRAKEVHRLVQSGLTFTEAVAQIEAR